VDKDGTIELEVRCMNEQRSFLLIAVRAHAGVEVQTKRLEEPLYE